MNARLNTRNAWAFRDGDVDLRRVPTIAAPLVLPTMPAPLTLDLGRTALLVIDMQNDFCTDGGWLSDIGVDTSVLGPAVDWLTTMVPTIRDAGVPVIWVNWGNRRDQANLPPGVTHVYDPQGQDRGIGSRSTEGAEVLTKGSWGAALIDALVPKPQDIHIDKFRMSGFWDTPLDSVLRNLRVDTLLFAGVNSDQCVYATLIDAACLGYDVVFVDGASATTSPSFCHDSTLYNVRQCYGFTVEAADLVDAVNATTIEENPT